MPDKRPTFAGSDHVGELLAAYRIAAIVIDNDARSALQRLPPYQKGQFESYVTHHIDHEGSLTIQPYGQIDVYIVR